MKLFQIERLTPGCEVFWHDPDNGIGSRVFKIKTIEIKGDVVCITDEDGSYLECFASELS